MMMKLAAFALCILVGGLEVGYSQVFRGLRSEVGLAVDEFGTTPRQQAPRFNAFMEHHTARAEAHSGNLTAFGGTCKGLAMYIEWCLDQNPTFSQNLGRRYFGVAVWAMPNGFPDPIASRYDSECNKPVPSDVCAQKASATYAGSYVPHAFQHGGHYHQEQAVAIVVLWTPGWQLMFTPRALRSLSEAIKPALQYCVSTEAMPLQTGNEHFLATCLIEHMQQASGRDFNDLTLLLILPTDPRSHDDQLLSSNGRLDSWFSSEHGGALVDFFTFAFPKLDYNLELPYFPFYETEVTWRLILLQDIQEPPWP